jgi:hypothetical protein
MSWQRRFDPPPIILPNGKRLVTLGDARTYLTSQRLPNSEEQKQMLANAISTVLGAAAGTDFLMHAHIAVARWVYRNNPPKPPATTSKDPHWGKRKLKRDR